MTFTSEPFEMCSLDGVSPLFIRSVLRSSLKVPDQTHVGDKGGTVTKVALNPARGPVR